MHTHTKPQGMGYIHYDCDGTLCPEPLDTIKTSSEWDVCECEHDRMSYEGNCNALTFNRRARCSCPSFKLAQ